MMNRSNAGVPTITALAVASFCYVSCHCFGAHEQQELFSATLFAASISARCFDTEL